MSHIYPGLGCIQQFDPSEQKLIAADEVDTPGGTIAAQQTVGRDFGCCGAELAADLDQQGLDLEDCMFAGRAGGNQGKGLAHQTGFNARERPDL